MNLSIPFLPDYRPLEISDKPIIDALFRTHPPETSEMTFTNLFAWGHTHPIMIAQSGRTVFFWRGSAEHGVLLPPAGNPDKADINHALSWATTLGGPAQFGRIGKNMADHLQATMPDLKITEDRENADYIYKQNDLAELAGRNFSGKRNLVKQFFKSGDLKYEPIRPGLITACNDAQALWCDDRHCSIHADLDAENISVSVALDNWETLRLQGGAFLLGQEVVAFTMGERLNADTAVIHFEKGNPNFKGVYQAINQAYCQNTLSDFEFVNREQDLGIEGLRKAKMSYNPVHLVMKYTLSAE